MELQRFFIKGKILSADHPQLQEALAPIYDTPERPRCMCVRGGVDMYIARHRDYVVKRMPGTGSKHHPSCAAFEPELRQSGLGELMGDAVIERSSESFELRVDFPMTRTTGKSIPHGETVEPTEIKAPRRRMSLLAVMHFLFERAGFNRWYPAMEGKRSQGVLHKYLMEAAEEIEIKGVRLSERLYVPEQFSEACKAEIAQRRRSKLAILRSSEDGTQRKMALMLGEFKGSEASSFGRKLWIKHMPDTPLFIENKAWERIERVYGGMFEARDADTRTRQRVVICALVYAKREHTYQIDTAGFMLITENWIPLDGVHEADLIQTLTEQKRRFMKPLRYDARSAAMFANVLLLDTGDMPMPLHILSEFMEQKERTAKEKIVKALNDKCWVWHTNRAMPELPITIKYKKTK